MLCATIDEIPKNKESPIPNPKASILSIKVENSLMELFNFYMHPIFALSLCKNTSIEFVKMSQ